MNLKCKGITKRRKGEWVEMTNVADGGPLPAVNSEYATEIDIDSCGNNSHIQHLRNGLRSKGLTEVRF
jgi:hypothetical protein